MAGLIGIVVGLTSLRVRHDFLAVTTMGIGFLFLGFVRKQKWLGAELGISGIPGPGLDPLAYALLIAVAAASVVAFSLWIKRSWMGFTFDAVADDEDAARTVGINVAAYKLTAFGIGTALAGLAGGLYVYFARIILPDTFDFVQSIAILTMVVIGGTGSVWGVVASTVALTLLPEASRAASDYRLLIFGGMLILVMRFSPGGLAGMARSSLRSFPGSKRARRRAVP
jgi:branched-chain amino acid transport system permease protein